ncbi:MAG: hypothetical protein ACRD3M_05505 [Thermoanaerobaculia bacterium]
MPPRRIGELLIAEGLLSPSAVHRALGFQKAAAPRIKLGSILLTWDLIDEPNLLKALAALHHCEAVTGDMLAAAPVEVVRMLPAPHAIRLNAIPYALEKSRIRVAFVNPSDLGAIDEVSALTGHACVAGVVTELRLLQAHRRFYGRSIPLELRPPSPRVEPSRATGRAPVPQPAPSRPIPVAAGNGTAEPAPITVPDLPIPAPPRPPRRETPAQALPASSPSTPAPQGPAAEAAAMLSGTERTASAMRMTSLPEPPPQREGALGIWSHAAEPPPLSEAEIGDLAVASVPEDFPRVILLARRPGMVAGWSARGVSAEGVAAIRLPDAEPSVFGAVRESGRPHFGRVEPDQWPEALGRLLDGPPPCAIFPVHSSHGVTALLYADRRGAAMKFDDTALLARAAAEIAALLAREARSPGPSTP